MPTASYLASRAYMRSRLLAARITGARATWTGLRILCYHSIADERHELNVSPAAFARQMALVRASGATPIRLADALTGARTFHDRHVAVTFDDGYHDNVAAAEPILAAEGIPGTVYLPTALLGGHRHYDWYDEPVRALSWEEVAAANERGTLDFQAHTRVHHLLPDLADEEARAEIAGSRADIEERLGTTVTSFAYPAGQYRDRDVDIAREVGYLAAVSTRPGVTDDPAGSFELPRTCIYGQDDDDVFVAKFQGVLDGPTLLQEVLRRQRSRSRLAS